MKLTFEELLASLPEMPDETEALVQELRNLPNDLALCGHTLATYAKSLIPKSKYRRADARYILSPHNFVAFTPRHKRGNHITVELRGNFRKFSVIDGVVVKDARAGAYSSCVLRRPSDLAAVASYIRRARELYGLGRSER